MQYLIQMEEDVILYILRVQCHLSLLKKPKRMVRRVDLSSNSLRKTYPNKDMGVRWGYEGMEGQGNILVIFFQKS